MILCTSSQREADTRPRGVVANMSPCHGEDRQFKSDQSPFFFTKIMPSEAQLVAEQRTENPGLTVRFCPEAPFVFHVVVVEWRDTPS